jgi:hypothetical protein
VFVWGGRDLKKLDELWRPKGSRDDSIKIDIKLIGGEDERVWTGLIWFRTEKSGGFWWTREWTFGFHKMRVVSWQAEELLASKERLCCTELVSCSPVHCNMQVTVAAGLERAWLTVRYMARCAVIPVR